MTQKTIDIRISERKAALKAAEREKACLEAIATLIENRGICEGPSKSVYIAGVKDVLVGIGRDNTATLRLFPDDIAALEQILGRELNYEDHG